MDWGVNLGNKATLARTRSSREESDGPINGPTPEMRRSPDLEIDLKYQRMTAAAGTLPGPLGTAFSLRFETGKH